MDCVSAVHHEICAGNHVGGVRRKEKGSSSDFLRLAETHTADLSAGNHGHGHDDGDCGGRGRPVCRSGVCDLLHFCCCVYWGGASPIGGGGTIVGTLIGALIMGVLQNGLVLLGVNTFVQQIVIGMLVIVAVMIDVYRNEKRKSG